MVNVQSTSPQLDERDPLLLLRRHYARIIAIVITGIGIVSELTFLLGIRPQDGQTAGLEIRLGVLVFGLAVLEIDRRGYSRFAANLLVLALTGAAVLALTIPPFLLVAILALISAATLSSRLLYILATIVILAMDAVYLMFDVVPASGGITLDVARQLIGLATLIVVSMTTRFIVQTADRARIDARRSGDLLQAVSEIGQAVSSVLKLDDLLNESVVMIRDRLGFYHVQIFLLNQSRAYAELVASSGTAGQALLAHKNALAVGSQSVIGRAIQIGESVIGSDIDTDAGFSGSEFLLPNTRSELAVPIMDGDKVIGALDVQSVEANAFNLPYIQALQVMANQLGSSIRNARLFEAQSDSVLENKRLLFESEANLREIQRLNQQLTGVAWEQYIREKRAFSGVTMAESSLSPGADWTPAMIEASQRRQAVTVSGDQTTIAVPIVLRGQVLGAIEIQQGETVREADTAEMVEAVAQRLAISLDRARLFEEAQETNAQQQFINQMIGQYQSAATIDDLLRVTLTELTGVLEAEHGAIRLGAAPGTQTGTQNGETA